jgi:hypothetical protein
MGKYRFSAPASGTDRKPPGKEETTGVGGGVPMFTTHLEVASLVGDEGG